MGKKMAETPGLKGSRKYLFCMIPQMDDDGMEWRSPASDSTREREEPRAGWPTPQAGSAHCMRRWAMLPSSASPASIMLQVSGSGTTETL